MDNTSENEGGDEQTSSLTINYYFVFYALFKLNGFDFPGADSAHHQVLKHCANYLASFC